MTKSSAAYSGHFDWLNSLAQMSDEEIRKSFSVESVRCLSFLIECLENCDDVPRVEVSSDNFVSTTRRMYELYKYGSKDLGQTIICADALLKQGFHDQAEDVYLEFLNRSKSKFYRDIALNQFNKIRSKR